MELVRESFEPLTPTEWMDMLNSSINEFEISSNDSKCVSSGFKVMGWKEKRVVEPNALRFEVSKEFEHMFASEFADIVWNRLLDPATYPKLFSGSLISKVCHAAGTWISACWLIVLSCTDAGAAADQ